jgi:diacylglycerol kinase
MMSDKPHSAQDAEEKKNVLVTPEGEEIELTLLGTAKLDPDASSTTKNKNRLASVKYAIAGLIYLLKREQSIQLATLVSAIVVLFSAWLQIDKYEWMFMLLALGGIWVTECVNTAIEASINLGTSDPNVYAKIGKDVASTATFISSIVFFIIVATIVLSHLPDRLVGL